MGYSIVQTASNSAGSGTTIAQAFTTSNVVQGNRIIVAAGGFTNGTLPTSATTCADGQSNSYSQHKFVTGTHVVGVIFSLVVPANIAGTKPTITVTWDNTLTTSDLLVLEASGLNGLNGSGAIDGSGGSTGSVNLGATGTAGTTMSPASTGAGNLVLSNYFDTGVSSTITHDASYTQVFNNSPNGNATLAVEHRTSTNGTSEADSWAVDNTAGTAAATWGDIIVSFLLGPLPPKPTVILQAVQRAANW